MKVCIPLFRLFNPSYKLFVPSDTKFIMSIDGVKVNKEQKKTKETPKENTRGFLSLFVSLQDLEVCHLLYLLIFYFLH